MHLINVETLQLEEFPANAPPYAILSHTWGAPAEEVLYSDMKAGNLDKAGRDKVEGCCRQAKKDGFAYAWIDTCCIDKTNAVELGEAINSMFRWYQRAATCYVYLTDVPHASNTLDPGSMFFRSRWFQRGWTLQELLAPQEVFFFDQTWAPVATKTEEAADIETITGIPRRFLLGGARAHEDASVAQRMSWAANRVTTREEDRTYCLLGLFGVNMPMIYGEGGTDAFIRLQQAIMQKTRDNSLFAWGLGRDKESLSPQPFGDAKNLLSAGIWASAPSDFANCGRIVARRAAPVTVLNLSGGRLQIDLAQHSPLPGTMYGFLNCGPENDSDKLVGMPLCKLPSREVPVDEYARPQGPLPVLISKTALVTVSATLVHIQAERQNPARNDGAAARSQEWLNLRYARSSLTLVETYPPRAWKGSSAKMPAAGGEDADQGRVKKKRYLARFRHPDGGAADLIVLIEIALLRGGQIQPECHVMVMSRQTALRDLLKNLVHMRAAAFRKLTARVGTVALAATVEEEDNVNVFSIKLGPAPAGFQIITVDADEEVARIRLKHEVVVLLHKEDRVRAEAEQVARQRQEKQAARDTMLTRIAAVCDQLKALQDEKKVLEAALEKEEGEIRQLATRCTEADDRQRALQEHAARKQLQIEQYEPAEGPGNWLYAMLARSAHPNAQAAAIAVVETADHDSAHDSAHDSDHDSDLVSDDAGAAVEDWPAIAMDVEAGLVPAPTGLPVPLFWAAKHGYTAMARLLIEKGAAVDETAPTGNTPLMLAASRGHEALVRLLLDKGASLESQNSSCWPPLLHAVAAQQAAVARLLIDRGADIDAKAGDGWTPLSYAARHGYEDSVRLLIRRGADVKVVDGFGWTPLCYAARYGYKDMLRLLIGRGSDVEFKTTEGLTPLYQAVRYGHTEVVQLLIDHDAVVDGVDDSGRTPLCIAAREGYTDIARSLIDRGANIKSKATDIGWTPLFYAARNGHKDIIRLLSDRGDDVNAIDVDGITPTCYAAEYGHKDSVQLLIDNGAVLHPAPDKNNRRHMPVTYAIRGQQEDVLRLLLDRGSDVNTGVPFGDAKPIRPTPTVANTQKKDHQINTALGYAAAAGNVTILGLLLADGARIPREAIFCAVENGHEAAARLLIKCSANVVGKWLDGRALLLTAAVLGHTAVVQLLIDNGVAVNPAPDEDNNTFTPLVYAIHGQHEDVVRLLLDRGADVNTVDSNDGDLPLIRAARMGHAAIVRLLIEKGARSDQVGDPLGAALSWAADGGYKAVVQLLIDRGAAVNPAADNDKTHTPLACAIYRRREDVVRLLLGCGADVNTVDPITRNTPLIYAVRAEHAAIMQMLLEKGANADKRGHDMGTPLHLAAAAGNAAMVKLLLAHGADVDKVGKSDRPLMAAARGGHVAVVKLLIDAGAHVNDSTFTGKTPLLIAATNGNEAVVRLLLKGGAKTYGRGVRDSPLRAAKRNGHLGVVRLLDGSTPL